MKNDRSADSYKIAKWFFGVDWMKFQVALDWSCDQLRIPNLARVCCCSRLRVVYVKANCFHFALFWPFCKFLTKTGFSAMKFWSTRLFNQFSFVEKNKFLSFLSNNLKIEIKIKIFQGLQRDHPFASIIKFTLIHPCQFYISFENFENDEFWKSSPLPNLTFILGYPRDHALTGPKKFSKNLYGPNLISENLVESFRQVISPTHHL